MPVSPETDALWDARTGLVHYGTVPLYDCVRRLHRALPTTVEAGRLVEALLERLGSRGRLDPYTDGTAAVVRRADPDGWWMRRSPAAFFDGSSWNEHDQADPVPGCSAPADAPPGWRQGERFRETDPRPEIVPPGLRHGALTLWSGPAVIELRYDAEGVVDPDNALTKFGDRWASRRWVGIWPPTVDPSARPPQSPPLPWLVDFPERISPEELAERILADDASADPVRVRMNVDAPGGVEGCWWRAKMLLRQLAMTEDLLPDGGVLVIDAFDHDPDRSCVALGADLAAAEAAWLVEAERVQPCVQQRPIPLPLPEEPPPPPPAGPEPDDTVVDLKGRPIERVIQMGWTRIAIAPVTIIAWPEPGPTSTPLVAVRFPPMPAEVPAPWRAAGFTRWRYLVGESGRVGLCLLRDEADGFTQVGDGLLDVLDPADLERQMDEALEADPPGPWPEPPWLRYPYEHRRFSAWSALDQGPTSLRTAGGSWNEEWNARDMDGDTDRWRVLRMRHHA